MIENVAIAAAQVLCSIFLGAALTWRRLLRLRAECHDRQIFQAAAEKELARAREALLRIRDKVLEDSPQDIAMTALQDMDVMRSQLLAPLINWKKSG